MLDYKSDPMIVRRSVIDIRRPIHDFNSVDESKRIGITWSEGYVQPLIFVDVCLHKILYIGYHIRDHYHHPRR